MKTTILVQDGNVQLVLTPEIDFEREIVEKYGKDFNKVQCFKGEFLDCQGGWTRGYCSKSSLMLRIKDEKADE